MPLTTRYFRRRPSRVSGSAFAPASVRFTTGTNVTSASIYCYKNDGSSAGACDDLRLTRIG